MGEGNSNEGRGTMDTSDMGSDGDGVSSLKGDEGFDSLGGRGGGLALGDDEEDAGEDTVGEGGNCDSEGLR